MLRRCFLANQEQICRVMMWLFAAAAVMLFSVIRWRREGRRQRSSFLAAYEFPASIPEKVRKTYPHLRSEQCLQVVEALREYFMICALANQRMVAMPSQVVDVAWHQFILFTRNYDQFCRKGLGHFLHHTPAEAMQMPTQAQMGIKRAWRLACFREGINPKEPTRLPLLFSLDSDFRIPDGFHYALDCKTAAQSGATPIYCGGDIGCSSGCSGDSGSSDSGSGSGCSGSGCSGGCGGGGGD